MITPHPRYEILDSIAQGDFATVYRGLDHELKRDVAVKQIHDQYLADPRQLDRYWQEAHLLASLQHPHIMTIYDIVRDRGWLILELMQGSLSQLLGGRPIDLKDLRLTLNYTLQALQTMHRHGILHGDIKPSNLLVDRNSRVKLGDFGIARRLAGEGSVVKGTTKYMAPEVLSDQFGPVGPHSDVYSLGFTAYELMCGEHFETLFPGLTMYGRDRQIAWMMWHSAGDRRLPEIARVLEGVPADLAYIIQKMTEKDPAKRYPNTDAVLADLKLEGHVPAEPQPEEIAQAERTASSNRRRRYFAIGAAAFSAVISIGLLFLSPGDATPPANVPQRPNHPAAGEIVTVDANRGRFFVNADGEQPQAVNVRDGVDRIYLNGQQSQLANLDRRDRVQIAESSSGGKTFLIIEATRDAAQEFSGTIARLDASSSVLHATSAEGQQPVEFLVNQNASIELNGESTTGNRPLHLADLRPTDQVTLRYKTREDERREVALIRAIRSLTAEGWLVNAQGNEIVFREGASAVSTGGEERTLQIAPDCVVTLNGQLEQDGRKVTLAELRPRDKLILQHDVLVHRVDAIREVQSDGVLAAIDLPDQTITVQRNSGETLTYKVTGDTRIEIAGATIAIELHSLRVGDAVTVRRRSTDPSITDAASIAVMPRYESNLWALVIEQADYLNDAVPDVPFAAEDATAFHQTLRYAWRLPENQCLRERNLSQARMQAAITQFAGRIPENAQAVIYFVGRGLLGENGKPLLAANDFDPARPAETTLELRWIIEQMEGSAAKQKLLILAAEPAKSSDKGIVFVGPTELAESARPRPGRAISTSVSILTSCSANETNAQIDSQRRTAFGLALTNGYSGKADANHDKRIETSEIASFVSGEIKQIAAGASQTPEFFAADPTPPRLSDPARLAVAEILRELLSPKPDVPNYKYSDASHLCNGQPDAEVAYALVLMKNDKSPLALDILEKVTAQTRDVPVAHEASAWLHARRGASSQAVVHLTQMIHSLPKGDDEIHRDYRQHAIAFAGRVAAYLLAIAPPDRRITRESLSQLEQALKDHDPAAHPAFIESGRSVRKETEQLESLIAESTNPTEKSRLELQRTNFNHYVPFNYAAVQKYLLAALDK